MTRRGWIPSALEAMLLASISALPTMAQDQAGPMNSSPAAAQTSAASLQQNSTASSQQNSSSPATAQSKQAASQRTAPAAAAQSTQSSAPQAASPSTPAADASPNPSAATGPQNGTQSDVGNDSKNGPKLVRRPPPLPSAAAAAAPSAGPKIEVPSGTHLSLLLHNAVSTRSARVGDPVYFETTFPVMIDGKVAIPAGSYVSGEVTDSKRAGRVKGRAELMIKLNTLILPNAYMVDLNAEPGGAGTGGGETVDNEGKIKGDSDKASDAGTIIKGTAIGAGIGGLATQSGKGAGLGAGVGAAAGLMSVLLTRGPDAELPRGSTVEAMLERPIFLDASKDQFSSPGQASPLAGPPNREPQRQKIPF